MYTQIEFQLAQIDVQLDLLKAEKLSMEATIAGLRAQIKELDLKEFSYQSQKSLLIESEKETEEIKEEKPRKLKKENG